MADNIPVGIFDNPDFQTLSSEAQWLYLLLLTHPDIDHREHIPVEPGTWATFAADVNPVLVDHALEELIDEGWLRSYVHITRPEHTIDIEQEVQG